MSRSVLARIVPAGLIVAAVGALFGQTMRVGLVGFDAYPIIASSRVQSLADLAGTFTEKLMDGRYASDFYRPLLNLTFAWDHALWGLTPFGYQLTNALLLAACAWVIWKLLRRMLGEEAWVGPIVGLLVFLLSPLQLEVLPVPPRRPELLTCGFIALALWLQLGRAALDTRRFTPWPALATLGAMASKETGFVTPLLVAVAVVLHSDRHTIRERLTHAARATAPHLVVAALFFVVRLAVLGGLGGHRGQTAAETLTAVPAALRAIFTGLVWPSSTNALSVGWPGVLLLLVLVLILGVVAAGATVGGGPVSRRSLVAVLVGLTWIGSLGLIYAAAGLVGPWYLLLPLAGWALSSGALAEGLTGLVEHDDARLRRPALAGAALLTMLLVWQASYSPLFRSYDEWQRATTVADAFLNETRARIDAAVDGTTIEAPPLPTWVAPRADRPSIRGAAIFADYSVQAWTDLVYPERRIRVRHASNGVVPPEADELLVLITRRRVVPAGSAP